MLTVNNLRYIIENTKDDYIEYNDVKSFALPKRVTETYRIKMELKNST